MLTLRNKSVNVSRLALIGILKTNLELYREQYKEAITLYRDRLQYELEDALVIVKKSPLLVPELTKLSVKFNAPEDHENDYIEILEMMEMSVDENINLDSESFRAYIKNDWSWSASLLGAIAANKLYIAGKMN